MSKYKNFTDMTAWRLSMNVATEIFKISEALPKKEDYGLTSQVRRSANSVPANIAEAFGRSGSADKRKFYDYARGSCFETSSHLIYGMEVGYLSKEKVDGLNEEIGKVVHELNKIKNALS